jgi:hypothetical protein
MLKNVNLNELKLKTIHLFEQDQPVQEHELRSERLGTVDFIFSSQVIGHDRVGHLQHPQPVRITAGGGQWRQVFEPLRSQAYGPTCHHLPDDL